MLNRIGENFEMVAKKTIKSKEDKEEMGSNQRIQHINHTISSFQINSNFDCSLLSI